MKAFKYIFLISFILILLGCGNKIISKTKTDFVYEHLNKRVEIVLENDVKFLVVGKSTKANFKTENIDLKKINIAASGIKLNKSDSDGFQYIITPNEETLVNGQLKIHFTESIKNEENFSHTFFINVKPNDKEQN